MDITKSQQGTSTNMTVHGAVVEEELERFDNAISECLSLGTPKIVLELSEVPFIDSAGLEMLLDLVSRVGKVGGEIRLAALNEVCREIFCATRMDNFFQLFEDTSSALRSMA